ILKKQQTLPATVGRTDPVASSSSTGFKSIRKIEFNRKKSVKEFIVGEDVDTIWGNSYEVSTDGTPSSGLEDATLGSSTCRNSTLDEQNKENLAINHLPPVDDSLRAGTINSANTSWDLSITLADDEKRKLRSETSAVFSQSLNTTERLLVEPLTAPEIKVNFLSVDESEVQAMDISPIKPCVMPSPTKSPRKMIYTYPNQAMFVQINDVPTGQVGEKRAEQKTPISSSFRTGTSWATNQTTMRGSSYNVSETWNSHPHAMYQQGMLTPARASSDMANVSSDVDTTIALTNAMTQVLQSCSNESIQKATNMELDESTTTLPSNALARARPSFLPSNQRPADESSVRTPPNSKQERVTLLGSGWEDAKSADLSSPVEGHARRESLSLENISILTETKQVETVEQAQNLDHIKQQPDAEKSSTEANSNGLLFDFGLSSLSLKLRPSSPEMPVVTKPRILRPTLPAGLLESATKKTESTKTEAADGYDRSRSVRHTARVPPIRQKAIIDEDEAICKKSLAPMDITNKPLVTTIHSRMTVGMVESPKQGYRPTVFHSNDIVIDRVEQNGSRSTIVCDENMELTTTRTQPAVPPNASRRTIYDHEPIVDELARTVHPSAVERMKRGTVHSAVAIDESDCLPHSPQTALANYRRTVYPQDAMKEDISIVPVRDEPTRKTIISNDDMVLDVCATPNAKTGSDASISCVVYGRNVGELSIHAANRNNVVDMKFARPSTFQPQGCEESTVHIEGERQTLIQVENMILTEGDPTYSRAFRQRLTTHASHAMEEVSSPAVYQEKKSEPASTNNHSRKSNFNAEGMELTLVEQTSKPVHTGAGRSTTYATEIVMDESIVKESEQPNIGQLQGEGSGADMVTPWQQSKIPRLTTHVREAMEEIIQRDEPVRVKPRHSTYDREDMDVTRLEPDQDEQDDRLVLGKEEREKSDVVTQPRVQLKSRQTIYEQEDMNATNVFEDRRVESSQDRIIGSKPNTPTDVDSNSFRMDLTATEQVGTVELKHKARQSTYEKEPMDVTHVGRSERAIEQQNDVTNYDTFLERYEMSHDTGHGTSAMVQQTDQLLEKQFNCTRLSKAYEQGEVQPLPARSRPSIYHAEAMNETNIVGNMIIQAAREENFAQLNAPPDVRFDSPMHMSPVATVDFKSKAASRQSTYHAEEMDSSTQLEQNTASTSSYGFRKSNLQSIAKQSAAVDMEGISLLESDETDPRTNIEPSAARGTIFFTAPAMMEEEARDTLNQLPSKVEEQRTGRTNNRLSIYDAAAMVEETVPINLLSLRQGQKSSPDVQETQHSAAVLQRKSNDCMDETIMPENIRVERNVRFTRQSLARMGSTVDHSPYVCPAQPIPSEETMELTTALPKASNPVPEVKQNRQTIHHPASMDLTLVGRETVTPPPSVHPQAATDRRTIYNTGAIEETPPHAAKGGTVPPNGLVKPKVEALPEIGQTLRRPRQTILIPQDMDVEDEEEEEEKENKPSFALSMFPRESTEDCIPRSASLLPKRAFVQQTLSEPFPELGKPNQLDPLDMYKHLPQMVARKNDIEDAHDLTDISMSISSMRPEVPCIGNITAMISMREITEALPPASFQDHSNSVSVICRVGNQQYTAVEKNEDDHDDETAGLQTLAFVPTRPNAASDDEFYDAEGDEEPADQLVDPLSLTKSRHLTMKFIDVDHLEQTNHGSKVSMLPCNTTSKRVHSQVLCSPIVNRPPLDDDDDDRDPLQMTNVRQTLIVDSERTPHGPIKKRARTSDNLSPPQPFSTKVTEEGETPAEPVQEFEQLYVKEERQTITNNPTRASQMLINDPSVFVLEEDDLLDDESDIPCASLTDETQLDDNESDNPSTVPTSSVSRPRLSKIAELSYYKDFANLTIDNLDSWERGTPTPPAHDEPPNGEQEGDFVEECISVSDEDSLIVTPPKVPLASRNRGGALLDELLYPNNQDEVLESTIANEIMYQIRQQHPIVEHPCCGMTMECICPLRRELKRRKETSDMVWARWCTRFEAIKQRVAAANKVEEESEANGDEGEKPKSFDEQIEELNWRLLRGQFDERYLFVKGELCEEDMSRRRSRITASGHYPETPSIAFLADNLRSYLAEQIYIDDGPPPGAPLPATPRITQLIANKLATDGETRWLLDCSEEGEGLLLFRHRTLRSFVLTIQLQPPRGKTEDVQIIHENWRLGRIQVRECQLEYVHSPKLLLAHIEFMRLAKETTEQTLRSTYRTVADLMGLWHRFNEQLERVFEVINRLLTIVRNNEALLCYDAQMDRFCVKKSFHRTGDDGLIDANVLQVHFNWIGGIGAPGVGFRWPMAEPHKLFPAGTSQQSVASGHFPKGLFVGTDHKSGLMFLECLLWNVTKEYES
uniref:Uncharacterized protein n=1 Tax=Anopheles christyi TaxID=43041 RepID=A0A182JYG6_9DIPT